MVLDPEEVAEVIVRATIKRLVTLDRVKAALAKLGRSGRTGVRNVRAAVAILEALKKPADSVLEFRFALMATRYALPPAEFQLEVRIRGERFFIDFAYPELKLAIEVDGYEKVADPVAAARSLRRQNALVLAGWTVLRFDWNRIVHRPHEVAAEILAALGTLTLGFRG